MYYLIPTTDTVKGLKFPFHSKEDRTFQRLSQAYLSTPPPAHMLFFNDTLPSSQAEPTSLPLEFG